MEKEISIVGCPYCGKKHRDDYCIKTGKIPSEYDGMLMEFGDDECNSDFAGDYLLFCQDITERDNDD